MRPPQLFDEVLLLFQVLKHWGEALHAGLELTAATRGVLELLLLGGAATVPQMARARGASRQHVQQLVDALLERDLVERRDNPSHKRSSFIALTDKGRALVENLRAEELEAISRIQAGVSDTAMQDAVQVLAAWRSALERDAEHRAPSL